MNVEWETIKEYTDIRYERAANEGIAKITINRPERLNAINGDVETGLAAAWRRPSA